MCLREKEHLKISQSCRNLKNDPLKIPRRSKIAPTNTMIDCHSLLLDFSGPFKTKAWVSSNCARCPAAPVDPGHCLVLGHSALLLVINWTWDLTGKRFWSLSDPNLGIYRHRTLLGTFFCWRISQVMMMMIFICVFVNLKGKWGWCPGEALTANIVLLSEWRCRWSGAWCPCCCAVCTAWPRSSVSIQIGTTALQWELGESSSGHMSEPQTSPALQEPPI